MSELKPCPFCGQREVAVIRRRDKDHEKVIYSMAQCASCLAEGPLALDEDDAVTMWNRRAGGVDAAPEKVARLLAEQAARACHDCCMRRVTAWRVSPEHADEVCAECQIEKAIEKARKQ